MFVPVGLYLRFCTDFKAITNMVKGLQGRSPIGSTLLLLQLLMVLGQKILEAQLWSGNVSDYISQSANSQKRNKGVSIYVTRYLGLVQSTR